jgi:hypothetical protein
VDEVAVAEHPGAAALLRLFRHHGARPDDRVRLKIQREAAATFALQVALEAAETTPGLLVEVVPGGLAPLPADGWIDGPPPNLPRVPETPPGSGQAAMVELARDIYQALINGAGRPMRVDPLVAFKTHETLKREHTRSRDRKADAIQKSAYRLRASVATIERALPVGRDIGEAIQSVVRDLPKGSKPLIVVADYELECLQVIVSKPPA